MQDKLTSRQKQALETKQRIKSAAIKLFEERGFENVYIEDIAAEAGCSVGNIYHYYKSKEELSMHMTEHVDAEYEKLAAAYRADSGHSALEKLLDFVGQSLRISSGETVLYASLIYGIKYPEAGMLDVKWDREYFRLLRELVENCQKEGSIPRRSKEDGSDISAEDIVYRLVTIHRGTLVNWRLCREEFGLVEMGRSIAENMIRGL